MLTLTTAIDTCRAAEAATRQLKMMATPDEVQALQSAEAVATDQSPSAREVTSAPTDNQSPSANRRGTGRRCKYMCNRHARFAEERVSSTRADVLEVRQDEPLCRRVYVSFKASERYLRLACCCRCTAPMTSDGLRRCSSKARR